MIEIQCFITRNKGERQHKDTTQRWKSGALSSRVSSTRFYKRPSLRGKVPTLPLKTMQRSWTSQRLFYPRSALTMNLVDTFIMASFVAQCILIILPSKKTIIKIMMVLVVLVISHRKTELLYQGGKIIILLWAQWLSM